MAEFDATKYYGPMLTIGSANSYALRITKGNLSRRGNWHPWWPCVFLIWKGRRVG